MIMEFLEDSIITIGFFAFIIIVWQILELDRYWNKDEKDKEG